MNKNFNIAGFSVSQGVCFLYNSFLAVGVDTKQGIKVKLKKINNDARLRKFPFIRALIFVIIAMKNAIYGYFISKSFNNNEKLTFYSYLIKAMKLLIYLISVVLGGFVGFLFIVELPNVMTREIFRFFGLIMVKAIYFNLLNSLITSVMLIFIVYIISRIGKRYFIFQNAVNKVMTTYRKQKSLDVDVVKKEKSQYFFNPLAIIFLTIIICIFVLPLFYEKNFLLNLIYKLVLFAIILSAVYEIFLFLNQYDNKFVKIITAPSFWVQKLLPSETDEESIMCAIVTLKEVLMMNEKDELGIEHNLLFEWQKIREEFLANNISDESDVDWIFCEVLKCNRAELKTIKQISQSDLQRVKDYAKERISGQPLQRIFGHANFYGFEFELNDDTLIPRFDTEILVETALKEIKKSAKKLKVLDLCTGSGCIAITLAKLTDCEVTAVDINANALNMARINADTLNAKVLFLQSNLFESISHQKYDLIISNPPYIRSEEVETLDVADFDPHLALDGGKDGLYFYRKIIEQAPNMLNKGGKIYFEIGKGQFEDVKNLLTNDFDNIRMRLDYQEIERVVYADLKTIN